MNLLFIEPYFTGSHAQWANELSHFSKHQFELQVLSGHYWKWRMHGGAITLATRVNESSFNPDAVLATDMIDLTTFKSLTQNKLHGVPMIIYFHENQITYPWSEKDRDVLNDRDRHYGFINYTSALAADKVVFNSNFHKERFLQELPRFLKAYPDYNNQETVTRIESKSEVLPVGINFEQIQSADFKRQGDPIILWNHRWEYDKNPELFFDCLITLANENLDFEVVVLGENFSQSPDIFNKAKIELGDRIIQFGFEDSKERYFDWLWKADIIPMTSNQEFFGLSLLEAVARNCYPLLPKRLVYPEHISPARHPDHFYTDSKDFIIKMKNLILNVSEIRSNRYEHFAKPYDWNEVVKLYDDLFEKL